MKKLFGILSISFFLVALMTSLAMAQAKPIEWKMISTWTPAINLIEADKYFVKVVNELSGGRFKITLHPAPELVPPNNVFDAISKGNFPIGGEWPNYWAGKNTVFDLLGSYPMGLCQYDYINWYYHHGGRAIYNEMYGKFNMVYFMHCVTPMESGIRTNTPIKSLADYKGKKLRMSGKAQGYMLKKTGRLSGHVSRRRNLSGPATEDHRRGGVQQRLLRLGYGLWGSDEVQHRPRLAPAGIPFRGHDQQGCLE